MLRNTAWLVGAQLLVTPLSILVNAIAARKLGPIEFGYLYLATSFTSFAFLFVEWGQSGALTRGTALDRSRSGTYLGSGLAFRLTAATLVLLVLPIGCAWAGYDRRLVFALVLTLLGAACVSVASACQDVLRGYERTDFAATFYVASQLLSAAVIVPTLSLGGGLTGFLTAQLGCATLGALVVLRMMKPMRVPRLEVRMRAIRELVVAGRPFLVFALVLALQPLIDVAMLSKFGSAAAMGWHAAARKLIGILIFPASALVAAAYPTLCRLYVEDPVAYRRTASDAFQAIALVVIPITLGCGLFPEIGIGIFSTANYAPAENNLRILAAYILLVYFSMHIGTCLAASGRQSGWTTVQLACLVVSLLGDPVLIRWFQAHANNGGLGVCVATVVSEVLMVTGGLYLLPRGILDARLARKLAAAVLAGFGMTAVAWALSSWDPLAAAAASVVAYVGCLLLTGAVSPAELGRLKRVFRSG